MPLRANPSRSDSNVKDVFLNIGESSGKGFPNITDWWETSNPDVKWIRAQPKAQDGTTTPLLVRPGSPRYVQPDGMWIQVGRHFPSDHTKDEGLWVDIMAFESMQQMQNFDKDRSRYFPSIGAYQLRIPKDWLAEELPYRGGGQQTKPRWELMGFPASNIDFISESHIRIPVRRLTVMFCLANDLYEKVRYQIIPEGHEYFMKHSSMGNQANIRKHVKKMDPENHWL